MDCRRARWSSVCAYGFSHGCAPFLGALIGSSPPGGWPRKATWTPRQQSLLGFGPTAVWRQQSGSILADTIEVTESPSWRRSRQPRMVRKLDLHGSAMDSPVAGTRDNEL